MEEGFKRFDGVTIIGVYQDSVTFKLPNGETRFAELQADHLQSYRYKAPNWNEPMTLTRSEKKMDEFKNEALSLFVGALTDGTKVNIVIVIVKKNVNVEIITKLEFQ